MRRSCRQSAWWTPIASPHKSRVPRRRFCADPHARAYCRVLCIVFVVLCHHRIVGVGVVLHTGLTCTSLLHRVGAEERKQTVTVKKVHVKQVDANVAQLRATKEVCATLNTVQWCFLGCLFGVWCLTCCPVFSDARQQLSRARVQLHHV